jgi:hypothetical protein
MREVTLLEESVCINRCFGPLGLNLTCEGLLLGMQRGARKKILMKLYLAHGTFGTFMTVNTLVTCFAGRGSRPSPASYPPTPSCEQSICH